jgi:hypothetical protein
LICDDGLVPIETRREKMRVSRQSWPMVVLVAAFLVTLASCAPVRLIAPYDERIEKGVTALQKDTTAFFTKIDRQGGSDQNDYKNHVAFYDKSRVGTKSLLIRAGAVPKNEQTEKQLEALMEKYRSMEEQHKTQGLSQSVIPSLESSFDQAFRAILTLEIAKKKLVET